MPAISVLTGGCSEGDKIADPSHPAPSPGEREILAESTLDPAGQLIEAEHLTLRIAPNAVSRDTQVSLSRRADQSFGDPEPEYTYYLDGVPEDLGEPLEVTMRLAVPGTPGETLPVAVGIDAFVSPAPSGSPVYRWLEAAICDDGHSIRFSISIADIVACLAVADFPKRTTDHRPALSWRIVRGYEASIFSHDDMDIIHLFYPSGLMAAVSLGEEMVDAFNLFVRLGYTVNARSWPVQVTVKDLTAQEVAGRAGTTVRHN